MKKLIMGLILGLTACSSTVIEKLSSWPYDGDDLKPDVQVLYNNPGSGNMATYRVLVNNPLYVSISVDLFCSGNMKEEFSLKPRTTRSFLMSGMQDTGPKCSIIYNRNSLN